MKTTLAILISALILAMSAGPAAASDLTDDQNAMLNDLTYAIYSEDLATVVAKTNKTSVKIMGDADRTALHEAAYRGYSDIAKYLVDNGSDVNARDVHGYTPLHNAASNSFRRYSSLDIVKMLIDKGADVNAKNKDGETPIYTPALNCDYVSYLAVELLLKEGADVNVKNNEGDTPLHVSAGNDSFDCVQILYDKGADLNAKNKKGKTASDLARENGHEELANALDEVTEKP